MSTPLLTVGSAGIQSLQMFGASESVGMGRGDYANADKNSEAGTGREGPKDLEGRGPDHTCLKTPLRSLEKHAPAY